MQFNVAWAYAKLGHYHTDLMAAIADVAISQTEELSVAHIINILWAFSVLNFPAPRMIEAMLAEVQRRMSTEQLTPQNVANLLWSTAVADALEPQFWQMCMQQLHPERSGCEFSELSPETSSQIFQAHLLVTARHPEADWAMDPVLLARGQETWSAAVHNIK